MEEKLFFFVYYDCSNTQYHSLSADPSPIVQCGLKSVGCIVYFWLDFALFQLISDASFRSHSTFNIIVLTDTIHPHTQIHINMETTLFTQENHISHPSLPTILLRNSLSGWF